MERSSLSRGQACSVMLIMAFNNSTLKTPSIPASLTGSSPHVASNTLIIVRHLLLHTSLSLKASVRAAFDLTFPRLLRLENYSPGFQFAPIPSNHPSAHPRSHRRSVISSDCSKERMITQLLQLFRQLWPVSVMSASRESF